ncbi:RNA polymerase sigma factor [Capillimicrobium parvum]|uniref:Uncharacterized protein n=1 Tax=Capillimicrobium parvum TaxID=2884022 RepID=A0A9E6Y2T6_9ACTN|nr:hypothetical protein [Capillimicrobium parvum]UGS38831.1 hypothetical protein DSM104329_05261 [Capillimicrobium parvum]
MPIVREPPDPVLDQPVWARPLLRQPDRSLMDLAGSGLPVAFAVLADRHRERLLAAAGGDEDRLRDTLLGAWSAARAGARPADPAAWLESLASGDVQAEHLGAAAEGDEHEQELRSQLEALVGAAVLPSLPPRTADTGLPAPAAAAAPSRVGGRLRRRPAALVAGGVLGLFGVAAIAAGAVALSGGDEPSGQRAAKVSTAPADAPPDAPTTGAGTTPSPADTTATTAKKARKAGSSSSATAGTGAVTPSGEPVTTQAQEPSAAAGAPTPTKATAPSRTPAAAPKSTGKKGGTRQPTTTTTRPTATVPLPTSTTTVPPITQTAPPTTPTPTATTPPVTEPPATTEPPAVTEPPATTDAPPADTVPAG